MANGSVQYESKMSEYEQFVKAIVSIPGGLRGVPAVRGVSETLWAQTRGEASPPKIFFIKQAKFKTVFLLTTKTQEAI